MEDVQRLIHTVAELQKQMSNMVRMGTVHEVKSGGRERKMRIKLGEGEDGKPILGPWQHSASDRGGHAEEEQFKKGQNVVMISPAGDFRQAHVMPAAENNQRGRPDHATDDSHTYQFEKLRIKKTKDAYDIWIDESKGEEGKSAEPAGSKAGAGGDSSKKPEAKPKMKVRLSDSKGITGRFGKDMRFAAGEKGVKLRAKDRWAVVTKDTLVTSHPWEIGADPLPNDDD
jgi:hypothetical protein